MTLTPPQADQTSSESPSVLLVDDNEAFLEYAASILALRYAVVGTVRNGPAALEAAAVLHPDVIVIDMSMPGMNGIEVLNRLRQSGSTAAVVFLSVYEEDEIILAAREAGASGYVLKQNVHSHLELAVREACAGRAFTSTTPRPGPTWNPD